MHVAIRDDFDAASLNSRRNEAGLGIVLGAQLARKAVTSFTANATSFRAEINCLRECRCTRSKVTHRVCHPLHQRLGDELRGRVRLASPRGTGVAAVVAVDVKDGFSFAVVRLDICVANRPCGRYTFFVLQDAEVLLAEANHAAAVELCTATNVVVDVGTELVATAVQPAIVRRVLLLVEDRGNTPVVSFAGHPVAPLKDQDVNPVFGQAASYGASSDSTADYDNVVMFLHGDFRYVG
ncbi:hypothetical protein PT2222_440014 [Paraburkholderia tropica]